MPAQRSDLHHQFVALLEKPDLSLLGKRHLQTDLVVALLLMKRVGRFRSNDRGGVLALRIENAREFVEPLAAQYFVGEQRHPFDGDGREVGLDFFQNAALGGVPGGEIGVGYGVGQQAVDDDGVHRQAM